MSVFRLVYYHGTAQHVEAGVIDREIRAFAGLLRDALARASGTTTVIQVLPPLRIPDLVNLISLGDREIALMNPLGYHFAHRRNPAVECVAIAQRRTGTVIGDTYTSQIYVNTRSGIRDASGLRGATIGYGSPSSTSGFLIPALELQKVGLNPFTSFRRIEFLEGHDLVAKALFDGRLDIGVGHDRVIEELSQQPGYTTAKERLVPILHSAPIPGHPVATNIVDVDTRRVLQDAVIAAASTVEGHTALGTFWGDAKGLSRPGHDAYASLDLALTRLSLTEGDLLKQR